MDSEVYCNNTRCLFRCDIWAPVSHLDENKGSFLSVVMQPRDNRTQHVLKHKMSSLVELEVKNPKFPTLLPNPGPKAEVPTKWNYFFKWSFQMMVIRVMKLFSSGCLSLEPTSAFASLHLLLPSSLIITKICNLGERGRGRGSSTN